MSAASLPVGSVVVEGEDDEVEVVAINDPLTEMSSGERGEHCIHISNVALWDASESRRVRVGWEVLDDGSKKRFDKKTGQVIDA